MGKYWAKVFFKTVNLDPNAMPKHDDAFPNPLGGYLESAYANNSV